MQDTPVSSRARLGADAALLIVTAIWGSTFVMVKGAVAHYPVLAFLALRFAVAALMCAIGLVAAWRFLEDDPGHHAGRAAAA